MKYILAIDPSIRSLGWAVFRESRNGETYKRIDSGQIKAADTTKDYKFFLENRDGLVDPVLSNKGTHDANDWVLRIDYMISAVSNAWSDVTNFEGLTTVVIELPYGAQAKNAGDIVKLTSFCFALREFFYADDDVEAVYFAPVGVWKGQLPKDKTLDRMNKTWGIKLKHKTDYDESDAIGIGTWYIKEQLEMECKK